MAEVAELKSAGQLNNADNVKKSDGKTVFGSNISSTKTPRYVVMKHQYAARPDKYLRSCFAVEYTRQIDLAPVFQIEFFSPKFCSRSITKSIC